MRGMGGLQKVLYLIMAALGLYIICKVGLILLNSSAAQRVLDSGQLQRKLEDAAIQTWAPGYAASVEERDAPDWMAEWMRQLTPVCSYLADGQAVQTETDAGSQATRAGAENEIRQTEAPETGVTGSGTEEQEANAGSQTARAGAGNATERTQTQETDAEKSGTGKQKVPETGAEGSETGKQEANAGSQAARAGAGNETERTQTQESDSEKSGAGNEIRQTEAPETGATGSGAGETETGNSPDASPGAAEAQPAAGRAIISEELLHQLEDYNYLLANYYTVDEGTTADAALLDADALLGEDLRLARDPSVPQILIYHTHSQETFLDSEEGKTEDSIVGMGEVLAQELRDVYGYNVIHDTGIYDLVDGVLDRSAAYDYAREAVEQILRDYPTIEVIIDLHRDGVDDIKFVTEIDGQPTSMIMFFNGISRDSQDHPLAWLENPYVQQNLAFSLQLQLAAQQKYPGFTRNIYLKAERFNLHLRPRSVLIEAGTQLNTVQEERSAMKPLAELLHQVLGGG